MRRPARKGTAGPRTNIRLRLRYSFRLSAFGYVLNDDFRLTQPIRAGHPFNEFRNLIPNVIMQNKANFCKAIIYVSSLI